MLCSVLSSVADVGAGLLHQFFHRFASSFLSAQAVVLLPPPSAVCRVEALGGHRVQINMRTSVGKWTVVRITSGTEELRCTVPPITCCQLLVEPHK